jgi:hypothetical protein
VRLCEAWDGAAPNTGKSAQAAGWKKKLEAFGGEAEKVPGNNKEEPAPQRSAEFIPLHLSN